MFTIKQNVSVQDLIDLDDMLSKQLAVVESEGGIITLNRGRENEQAIDERVLNISHSTYCPLTGDKKADCQYSLPVSFLLEIGKNAPGALWSLKSRKSFFSVRRTLSAGLY